MRRAELLKHTQITATAFAEEEVRADKDMACIQALYQQFFDEVLGRSVGQGLIEAEQTDGIGTGITQGPEFLSCPDQPRWWIGFAEKFAWQRFETDDHQVHIAGIGKSPCFSQQVPVPKMQSIERTDTDHASARTDPWS